MVENDQDADIESRTNVLTDHHGCSITTSIRSSDYVNFATSYGLGQELVEDNGFQQPSTEHTGMFQSNPGLAEDARVVTHNMVGNGHDVGIESRTDVPTNHHGNSFPTRRRSSDYVNSASRYGLGQELMEDNGFQKPSTKYTDMFQSNSPQSFSKPILEETSSVSDHLQQSSAILVKLQNSQYYRPILQAIKDQFRPSPAARHLMEPHNSELSFSALDGDRLPRSNALYSTSYGDGVGASNIPYDPDVPRPGNSDSPFSHLSHHDHANRTSMLYPGAAYPENVQRNSSGIEGTKEDTSACSCSLNRSSSFVLTGRYSVSSQEELDHQVSQLENDEAFSKYASKMNMMLIHQLMTS
ncbi:hypothetical protein OIU85_010116 [Salix viminalis]|uniref:Uncharacterized protein n=1 Tax=Salix viminalis TaxID=40686 RepID=A0A9Q0SH72_SALVM|nr:hypothetical protein OIU85_010116 [Salix viminalis]